MRNSSFPSEELETQFEEARKKWMRANDLNDADVDAAAAEEELFEEEEEEEEEEEDADENDELEENDEDEDLEQDRQEEEDEDDDEEERRRRAKRGRGGVAKGTHPLPQPHQQLSFMFARPVRNSQGTVRIQLIACHGEDPLAGTQYQVLPDNDE